MLPPHPPPLPPMRASRRSKLVNAVSSEPPSLLDTQRSPDVDDKIDRPFHPCHMFFYGSLKDAEVLQTILDLSETPSTIPATLSGFKVKMWGIYPALIPEQDGEVAGCVWKVDDEAHFDRLSAYETGAYTWVECEVRMEDGTVLKDCRTFCWGGDSDSNELEDGAFDLERYQKYFKSSVVRRR